MQFSRRARLPARCGDAAYRYAGALSGYIYLANALYSADAERWRAVRGTLDERVVADLRASGAYWAQFEGLADTVSNAVYDGFLRATAPSASRATAPASTCWWRISNKAEAACIASRFALFVCRRECAAASVLRGKTLTEGEFTSPKAFQFPIRDSKKAACIASRFFGAGMRNRTRLLGLGSRCTTDVLTLQSEAIIADFPAQCKAKFACRHSFPYMPPAGGIGWGKDIKRSASHETNGIFSAGSLRPVRQRRGGGAGGELSERAVDGKSRPARCSSRRMNTRRASRRA